jgi:hypothetical protein
MLCFFVIAIGGKDIEIKGGMKDREEERVRI